jgi:hypothetical protein
MNVPYRAEKNSPTAARVPVPILCNSNCLKCEAMLLRPMAVIPLQCDNWVYLDRPDPHGLRLNPIGIPAFNYAWIESNRRIQ